MRTVASLLIGFLIFGSALVVTGGGEFFMAFATALMGKSRGGPAKVAILSSGFFGSLSGRPEEHTSELQSLMRTSYAVFCLKKKNIYNTSYRYDINLIYQYPLTT